MKEIIATLMKIFTTNVLHVEIVIVKHFVRKSYNATTLLHFIMGFSYDVLIANIFFAFIYSNPHMRKKFTIHYNTSI